MKTIISKNILTNAMLIKTVKVSDKGQIAIPQEMRKETGIERGDDLILVQDGKRILIERTQRVGKKVKDDFSDLLKISAKSLMKVWDNKKDEIWNEYLKK